ncbi:MAG: [FeFe] hydrogenase H-cluster maturation GTPase HydF [Oscillospiraceae bacterium]
MSLNDTPSANRLHIGFFGLRNAGKSSVVNAVTGQDLAVVSGRPGTTTDPVQKAMELLPLGPVVIIDTPGYDDDEQELGQKRVLRTKRVLNKTDVAVLVVDGTKGLQKDDCELLALFHEKNIPHLVVFNKKDLFDAAPADVLCVSAVTGEGIFELKERLGALAPKESGRKLLSDLVSPDGLVVLVTPIDESAPKGRMILPQVQAIRDVLDGDACCVVVKETQLAGLLSSLGRKPDMVVTDSQAFAVVSKIVPEDIPLTSFSILMARHARAFWRRRSGARRRSSGFRAGDKVLISEGCTHHRQCGDIGAVKLPRWLKTYSGADISVELSSGTGFPEDLGGFSLVLHCGGCMLSEREMLYRMKCAQDQGIPFTNYGVAIACMNGILPRSLSLFPALQKLIEA